MEGTELDIQLDDLETRVERLRSLYEQYFLGIEKIPPQVAQKDVDRRIHSLRREQIRNTARRFKLQTIIQRYNTFQQYWMRIMREIENGTYRRHVLRAERTVGVTDLLTAAERKRQALPEPEPRATTPSPETQPETTELRTPRVSQQRESIDPDALVPPSPQVVRAEIERELGLLSEDELDGLDTKGLSDMGRELDDPLLSSMPPPIRRKPTAKPIARRSARPSAHPADPSPPQRASPRPSGSASPTASSPAAARAQGRSLRPSRMAESPPASRASGGGLKLPASSAVAGRGLPPPLRQSAPRGAPTRVPSSPILAVTSKQPTPASSRGEPGTVATSASVAAPQPSIKAPDSSLRERQALPVSPKRAEPAPSTSSTPPRTHPNSSAPTQSGTLDRARVERLAEKLRAARQQTNESAPVSVDALAKKLQASVAQLREKHQGKQVDFEVIIRDGKAILKPIVR